MNEFNKNFDKEDLEVKEKISFMTRLRGNFLAGLLVLMPLVLTLWIFKTIIFSLDAFMQSLIPLEYIQTLTLKYENPVFHSLTGETTIPGLGLLLGFVFIVTVGIFAKNVIGRKMFGFWDHIFDRTPLIRSIYSAIKQITHTISNTSSASFREVVLIEYPRKGCWVVAFVSGNTTVSVKKHLTEEGDDLVNVFVPTTPNPTSGFLVFVPRSSLKHLDMTVEQGLKLVISAGIVAPTEKITKAHKNK